MLLSICLSVVVRHGSSFWLVDDDQDRTLLFRRPGLVPQQHPAARPFVGEHLQAYDPRTRRAFGVGQQSVQYPPLQPAALDSPP